jgi:hypothetical protein
MHIKPWTEQNLDAILATTAKLLVRNGNVAAASILANAEPFLRIEDSEYGQNHWKLNLVIPAEAYFVMKEDLTTDLRIEYEIDGALRNVMQAASTRDYITCRIVPAIEEDQGWRDKMRQLISGEGISNQGRVRSDNIATRQYDGLLFRSRPEVYFYDALKREGVPFAPLSVGRAACR